ncbi:MAG TPA: hypothetical protein VFU86_22320 [Terriglobales bacterium]|nr:hypothetical protein [Terriglobales bacterium]
MINLAIRMEMGDINDPNEQNKRNTENSQDLNPAKSPISLYSHQTHLIKHFSLKRRVKAKQSLDLGRPEIQISAFHAMPCGTLWETQEDRKGYHH